MGFVPIAPLLAMAVMAPQGAPEAAAAASLPEPIVSELSEENPAEEAELADSVGLAMLVVLGAGMTVLLPSLWLLFAVFKGRNPAA